jgi:hypothetical protein
MGHANFLKAFGCPGGQGTQCHQAGGQDGVAFQAFEDRLAII